MKSCAPSSAALAAARTRAWMVRSPCKSVTPEVRIASRCAPRAITETSCPDAASLAAKCPPTAPAPNTQIRKASPPRGGDYRAYWLFCFAGSLDGLEDELELDGLDEDEPLGLDEEPAPAAPEVDPDADPEVEPEPDWSVEELDEDDGLVADGLEDEGLDEDGLEDDGLDGVDRLELDEDGLLDDEPVAPVPEVPRSAPRSQAAIRLAPSARETATARVETFMLPP